MQSFCNRNLIVFVEFWITLPLCCSRGLPEFLQMEKKISKAVKYILSAAVAAVLLYFSFRGVKWDDFIGGLKSCRWGFIVLSMMAGIFAFWLRGLRWREILLPIDGSIRRRTAFNAVNIGYIANFVFPRIGEFVRCGFITRNSVPEEIIHSGDGHCEDGGRGIVVRKKASYDRVLGTVVLERSWDMIVMFLFLVALLVFRWSEFGEFFLEKMWKPIATTVNFSIWWIVLGLLILTALAVWRIVRAREKNPFFGKICGVFTGLVQGFASFLKMEHKWRFLLYTILIWGMYWLMSAATMWALPDLDSLGLVDALFLMVAGSVGWLVPVPGGFGSFHYIVSLALSVIYGIPFEQGIIFATLSHESQAITMAVCGGASYLYETMHQN